MNITRKILAHEIASKTRLPVGHAEPMVEAMFDSILSHLKSGDTIEIRGFGTFSKRSRKSKPALNPRTGNKMTVMAREVPFLRFSDNVRKDFNRGNS